jgi:hypothetical protein
VGRMSAERMMINVEPWIRRFEGKLGLDLSGMREALSRPEQRVPHTQLRLVLQADPAMEGLLAGLPGCVALGDDHCTPFRVVKSGLVLLPPVLVMHPGAAAVAARWGAESLHAVRCGRVTRRRIVALLRHGAKLLEMSGLEVQEFFGFILPNNVMEAWRQGELVQPSEELCGWQASLMEGVVIEEMENEVDAEVELELPLEAVLVAGGDSRLFLNAETGLNKYGVCPRPRPEAVHFSSSTASAISEHGFLYGEMLRRCLLDEALETGRVGELRRRVVDAIAEGVKELLGLSSNECDVVITPSGTDAELVSVMVSLAGAKGRKLTNVLVSPEESGKGVGLAGAGKYFDDLAATKEAVRKGASAFEGNEIEVCELAIRDNKGHVRDEEEMDSEWLRLAESALEDDRHVLAHVLLGSKTGLSAPRLEVVERLVERWPGRVDVVVDACQMRSEGEELGAMVRRGWMVQVSGSKFLTGPPFSGGLMVPIRMRERAEMAGGILNRAVGVSLPGDWPEAWEVWMKSDGRVGSFGSAFRWVPALMEGALYAGLSEGVKNESFERFRAALLPQFSESPYVEPIADEVLGSGQSDIGRLSILAFQVLGRRENGGLEPLTAIEGQWLFEQLNRDMSEWVEEKTPREMALARLCCHIGQPVVLRGEVSDLTFLRLVLGARFFNMVGYASGQTAEAVLESEIADAKRVLSKIEWIAEQWWRFQLRMGVK